MERAKRKRYPLWLRIALALMFAALALVATAVVLRFWIIAGLCVALGLGLFYAQWVAL
jgi:hypothetical protein